MATYHITNAAQLQAMNDDLAGDYILDNDIDLDGVAWTPIGTSVAPFTGTFDGQLFTLSNLSISFSTGDISNSGLFGYINGSQISNIILYDATISASTVGGVSSIGGLCGYANNSTFNKCASSGDISISSNVEESTITKIGTLIGSATICDVDNCYAGGSIAISTATDENTYVNNVAGLIGYYSVAGTHHFRNSYANVSVTITDTTTDSDSFGGLIGQFYCTNIATTFDLTNCYSVGSIVVPALFYNVGGFVGKLQGVTAAGVTISNCSWYTGASTYAIGSDAWQPYEAPNYRSNFETLSELSYGSDEADNTALYSKTHAVYAQE
jgi:hypothetical protein